jgi:hypothetical protein
VKVRRTVCPPPPAEDWRKVLATVSTLLATRALDEHTASALEVVRSIARRRLELHDAETDLLAARFRADGEKVPS